MAPRTLVGVGGCWAIATSEDDATIAAAISGRANE
jgi:hypothetical protein